MRKILRGKIVNAFAVYRGGIMRRHAHINIAHIIAAICNCFYSCAQNYCQHHRCAAWLKTNSN